MGVTFSLTELSEFPLQGYAIGGMHPAVTAAPFSHPQDLFDQGQTYLYWTARDNFH
jgi:hypothetical protein